MPLSRRRVILGWALATAGPVLVVLVLSPWEGRPGPSVQALSLLVLTVACALAGGLRPALVCAVASTLLLNYFYTPPLHTLTVTDSTDVVTLLLFLAVAAAVASVVDHAARRSVQAEQARREADTLSLLNHTLLRTDQSVASTLRLVCETFAMRSAVLLRKDADGRWQVERAVGVDPPTHPDEADAQAPVSDVLRLALRGHPLSEQDVRVLSAFATHLTVELEREEIVRREEAARRVEEGDRLRTALLAAVSHDLRTPLAGVKAAVSTLQTPGIEWSETDRAELLAAIEQSADRLDSIVENLLDMSRLQTGAMTPDTEEVGLDEIVARAVGSVVDPREVDIDLPSDLPDVRVDVGLLDRVIANLVQNGARYTRPGERLLVAASPVDGSVQLRVVDHGPGVPDELKTRLFEPFQRLDDAHAGSGVGLGLAVARGLTEAQGGRLRAEDTPGGGMTMVVELPCAAADPEVVERR